MNTQEAVTPKKSTASTKRMDLLNQPLASGRTIRELYESWGIHFTADGYMMPAAVPSPAGSPARG